MKNNFTRFLILVSLVLSVSQLFSQTYNISTGGTENTCSGTVYDTGGVAGEYSNSEDYTCLLYTSPSPRDVEESRMPSSA